MSRLQEYWEVRGIRIAVHSDEELLERMKADRDALDNDIRTLESKMAREYAEGEMATARSTEPED